MDVVSVVLVVFFVKKVPFFRSWALTGGLVFVRNLSLELCQCIVSCPICSDCVVVFKCGIEVVYIFLSCVLHTKVVDN